jgi:hypothetical protein
MLNGVLLLLMGLIYEAHRWDGLRWHDLCNKFHEDLFKHSGNIKFIINSTDLRGPNAGTSNEMDSLRARYAYEVSWRSIQAFE